MITKYSRPVMGQEVDSPAGYYVPLQEGFFRHNGRTVVYVLGRVCLDSSCCAEGAWNYIQIPGYLTDGQATQPLSASLDIETIEDAKERADILHILTQLYPSADVEMW